MPRLRVLHALGLLAALPLAAQVPLPLPPAAQILKPIAGKLVDAILKPKMKVDHFTLGGFSVKEVDPTGDATPEKFEGTGVIELPAPGMRLKITFKNLVLKGSAAEGSVEAEFADGYTHEHQGWTYRLSKAVVSDKAAHLEGTASLAGIRLNIAGLALTPAGLQGTVAGGDLPLAEGAFTGTLLKAEVTFGAQPPQLKGALRIELDEAVRHALTGEIVRLELASVAFDSHLLTKEGTGSVAENLAVDLPVRHKGHTWRLDKVAFAFDKGKPRLGSPARLQFPLNVFGKLGATGQPYITGSSLVTITAWVPSAPALGGGRGRPGAEVASRVRDLVMGFEGFSGSFPLPAENLIPSGLTAYHLKVEGGQVVVVKGAFDPATSRISGRFTFGTGFKSEAAFTEAPVSFENGLYLSTAKLPAAVSLGDYKIQAPWSNVICDFSNSQSPEGVEGGWKGVYLTQYLFTLPGELYVLVSKENPAVSIPGEKGWFEGNGLFSGDLAVTIDPATKLMLYIAPVTLDPFELNFVDGVLLKGPTVTGKVTVEAPPLLKGFEGALTFKLTQNGLEQIQVIPDRILKTDLIGVDIALDSAVLNPNSWDFSGRFDFHTTGANLPSFPFEHMILEAIGSADGEDGQLSLGMAGALWTTMEDHPNVDLWGFNYGLAEHGFGTLEDGRFFVGFGGEVAVNPLLPGLYNRVLFTTEVGNNTKGTLELEKPYALEQDLAGMGQLKASMGFHVETAGEDVSTAYFLGEGQLMLNSGEAPYKLDAGFRFGRGFKGGGSFPYFYALGHLASDNLAVPLGPDFEMYGFLGGLAQNFKPEEIRDTKEIKGTADPDLGFALIAGVDAGTTDERTFHGALDLYIAQNFTTKIHGDGWLFCARDQKPADNHVWADINFTRKPNVLDATFGADISQGGGAMRYIGLVQLHLSPDKKFLHIGTKEAPVRAIMSGIAEGTGYFTADFNGKNTTFAAGIGISLDTGRRSWGPLYGRAWMKANGDLVIEIPASGGPRFRGTIDATGGAEFGMEFSTFWDDYDITLFSGELHTNLAFQVPGDPKFSGVVTLHYSVLGGLFEGDASAHLDF
ncbi:MAG TPA: hypothetical protein VJ505_10425 [Holophagaceae bacterium]|nr:hypothetical protein [Holophagaceae bacterium]